MRFQNIFQQTLDSVFYFLSGKGVAGNRSIKVLNGITLEHICKTFLGYCHGVGAQGRCYVLSTNLV